MKPWPILSSVLAVSLAIAAPNALAHVGHGDEFQSTGGINRVEVKPETDALLGIQASPIEAESDGSSNAVRIPVTALVDDNGRQLVFVQYEGFYEPVEVTTGETQGELIEVTTGLSVGEQLITQGSLSLYAESRKTQTAEAPANGASSESQASSQASGEASGTASSSSEADPGKADAKGTSHSHGGDSHSHAEDAHSHGEESHSNGEETGMSKTLLAGVGGGIGLLVGAIVLLKNRKLG